MLKKFNELREKLQAKLTGIPGQLETRVEDYVDQRVIAPVSTAFETTVGTSTNLFNALITAATKGIEEGGKKLVAAIEANTIGNQKVLTKTDTEEKKAPAAEEQLVFHF